MKQSNNAVNVNMMDYNRLYHLVSCEKLYQFMSAEFNGFKSNSWLRVINRVSTFRKIVNAFQRLF